MDTLKKRRSIDGGERMYAQETKTLRVNETEQVQLADLATWIRSRRSATASEATVDLVASILEAVGRGAAVTIAPPSGYVSLIDARRVKSREVV